ncbi:MAG: PHB depolymerase family esterase [Bacteroidota bacterium]
MPTKHLFLFGTFFLLNLAAPLFAQQKIKGEIQMGDQKRTYRLYLPSTYTSERKMPLVFNLHGLTSDPGQQQLISQMNKVAEENGFIVCYPKGKNRAWNVNFPFPSSKEDDVQFISDLIDHLKKLYNVDLCRVYACGFSNGGYMSHRLACELSDRIVAIASVAGSIVPKQEANCTQARAVPVLQIHGKGDPVVPYRGNFTALPVEDLIDFWVEKNGCSTDATKTKIPNSSKLDLSKAIRYNFGGCRDKAAVAFYKVKNGGHTWPGSQLPLGITNRDFDASEEIWQFFSQFSFEKK